MKTKNKDNPTILPALLKGISVYEVDLKSTVLPTLGFASFCNDGGGDAVSKLFAFAPSLSIRAS